MAQKEDLRDVAKSVDTPKVKSIHGLSDGHVYVNVDAKFIQKLASENNLEIFTYKGDVIEKIIITTKPESKDATIGS